jgi:hypothetical protein
MSRDYTAVPHEYLEEMDILSDAEFGRLIRALLEYSMTGEEKELSGGEKAHWKRVRNRENRYQESFADNEKGKTERARNAAKARWNNAQAYASDAKNANACTSISSDAKNAYTNTKAKADTKAKKDIYAAFAADDRVLLEALAEFDKMRTTIKKPMTDKARERICKNLSKLAGEDKALMVKILEQSTFHCWQDVYALKQDTPVRPAQTVNNGYVHGADRLLAMIERGDFDD